MLPSLSTTEVEGMSRLTAGRINEAIHAGYCRFAPQTVPGRARRWTGPALIALYTAEYFATMGLRLDQSWRFAGQVYNHLTDYPDAEFARVHADTIEILVHIKECESDILMRHRLATEQ